MRILIVTQYFWPESFRINDLATNFANNGHQVTVLTGLPNYPEGSLYEAFAESPKSFNHYRSIDICRIPHVLRGKTRLRLALNYLSFFVSASVIGVWKLRKFKYDAIFVFGVSPITVAIPAIALGWLKRAPVFLWVQDLWPESLSAVGVVRSHTILRTVGSVVSWIYGKCDHILIQSRSFAPSVCKYCSEAERPGKVLYFPNWAEEVYREDDTVEQNAVVRQDDLFTVMFAGNVGDAQDFPSILDAAEALKSDRHIRWVIIGDGRARDWVSSEITRRGLESCFQLVGRFPVETMPAFFACADALLVVLKEDDIFSRTVPSKVQSYLAAARPIIGMINGEARAVINESGGGMACASGASSELVKIVRKMAGMEPKELKDMGLKGRCFYEKHFDRNTLFAKLEGYFDSATRGEPLLEEAIDSDRHSEAYLND